MEDQDTFAVSVSYGNLFQDISYLNDDSRHKYKTHIEIQKIIGDKFKEVTGFDVDHSRFSSVCRTFLDKIKKNKGRKDINLLLSDFYEKYITIEVKSEIVNNSSLFSAPLPLPTFPSSSSTAAASSPTCATPSSIPRVSYRDAEQG